MYRAPMTKIYPLIILLFICCSVKVNNVYADINSRDTSEVIKLNKQALDNRYTSPEQTIEVANKALALARELNYNRGIGEAYRVIGIGNYYLNQAGKAIDNYLKALDVFKATNDLRNQAKVLNNIGNLYLDNNKDKALEYLNQALGIAQNINDQSVKASIMMNIGNVYYRNKSYNQALTYYDKSNVMFSALGDSINLVQVQQNRGVIYYNLHEFDKAETLLLAANKAGKELDLNKPVASTNLTLATLYIAQGKFDDASRMVTEGQAYAKVLKDEKLTNDYNYIIYQLESKRKNYEKALYYLQLIFRQDSVIHSSNESTQITMLQEQYKQAAMQREKDAIILQQQNDRIKFWAVTIVAGLLLVVIALLVTNVKRKANTNAKLTELNGEVSKQKDNLNRVNHHLEEIIDERTKDLQVKNRKLSEYSSYLSHQIRGPIATLRGLMNLEKEGLVDEKECIKMMDKCVSDIDQKIIEMSDMLNDSGKTVY